MDCVFYCAIVLRILLLTLLMLRSFASKLSSACSQFIQQFSLPSPLYLRSSGGSSSPSIHTPSSSPSTPYAMASSLSFSSSDTTRLSPGNIFKFSPQRPGKSLWIVWDSHPLFPPSGFLTAYDTPMLRIFNSCSNNALSISVGIKCAIFYSLFLHCFNMNMLHVQSCPFSPSKPCTLGSR